MTEFQQSIDRQSIDRHIEEARAARADALAKAFGAAARQIKSLFSTPETGPACKSCGSHA